MMSARLWSLGALAALLAGCRDDGKPDDSQDGPEAVDADADGVTSEEDCDDTDPAVHPGAPEGCDGVDNDCDGLVDADDPDVVGTGAWYTDGDGDGFGDPGAEVVACAAPEGAVADSSDCDDADPAIHPDALEVCDGTDNNCDGLADDDDTTVSGTSAWYADSDGDSYGDPAVSVMACDAPAAHVADATDCDDTQPAANPGETEVCDGLDNNCDGETDGEDSADVLTWYADEDGDGYGDPNEAAIACVQPSGFVAVDGDCDDLTPLANPDGVEVCDGLDNNCDGRVDPSDAQDVPTWYTDGDGDGYGDPSLATVACTQPPGAVATAGDCDDADSAVNPGEMEVCDSADTDEDCDGAADDDDSSVAAGGQTVWYADADGDGTGDSDAPLSACDQPSGYVSVDGDCDDSDPSTSVCECTLSKVAVPVLVDSVSTTYGAWMADPLETLGAGLVWEMTSYTGSTIVQYPSEADFVAGTGGTSITLPTSWDGTGAVVYDGYLYYVSYNSNTIVQYDLLSGTTTGTLTLSDAGYHNTYHYQWGGWSDIDLAVDEQGLWAIYATSKNSGRVVFSSIDPATMTVIDTWKTASDAKTSLGNAFMICGVLYTINDYSTSTTSVHYYYDTNTDTEGTISLTFTNPGGYNSYVAYNHNEGLLYSWDSGRRQTYAVTTY